MRRQEKGMKSTSMAYQKVGLEPPFNLLFALLSLKHIVAELACPDVFAVVQVGGYRPGLIFDFGGTVWIAGERLDGRWFGALGDFAGGLEGVRKKGTRGGEAGVRAAVLVACSRHRRRVLCGVSWSRAGRRRHGDRRATWQEHGQRRGRRLRER